MSLTSLNCIIVIFWLNAMLSTYALDMTALCAKKSYGDYVENPLNCASYFLCIDQNHTLLQHCPIGLHFDAGRKICNWPSEVNCRLGSTVYPVFNSTTTPTPTHAYTDDGGPTIIDHLTDLTTTSSDSSSVGAIDLSPIPTANDPLQSTTDYISVQTTPNTSDLTTSSSSPPNIDNLSPLSDISWFDSVSHTQMGAFSLETGKLIDPMIGYNRQVIRCSHYGVYFLPHPRNCQKYFICSYGHLRMHQCGEGIRWSYKEQQCSITAGSPCYHSDDLIADNDDESQTLSVFPPASAFPGTLVAAATSQSPGKICYDVITYSTTGDIPSSSQSTVETPSTTPSNPTNYSSKPTKKTLKTPLIVTYSPTKPTAVENNSPSLSTLWYSLTTVPAPITDEEIIVPECPVGNQKAYLSYPYDCNKYYICILGTPVLTSCPAGLYWDQVGKFCGRKTHAECQLKKSY